MTWSSQWLGGWSAVLRIKPWSVDGGARDCKGLFRWEGVRAPSSCRGSGTLFPGCLREDRVWGPGAVGGAPHQGNGSVVEQLRRSWACGLGGSLVGACSPSPHLRSAAVSCLLSGGPWPGRGCCFCWPSGVQPCPQVSPLPASLSVPCAPAPNHSFPLGLRCG